MTGSHSLQPILDFVLNERGWTPSPRLSAIASMLPPVPCAGFEFDLGGNGRVDLQQRIRGEAELSRLRHFLRSRLSPAADDAWAALTRFCQHEHTAEIAEELWLELDDAPAQTPPLSIFAKLPETVRANRSAEVGEAAILRLLHAFGSALSESTAHALRTCLRACRDGAGISHLGMMLGRAQAPLRLNIESIPADDFGGFLDRVGLGHLAARVQTRVDVLFVYADRIRLALTLTERLEENIGLECFVGEPWYNDARIQPLFTQLPGGDQGTHELRHRLLAWPASLLPHQVREGWPGVLIAQALGEGPEQLSWLDCRISHVKLNVNGDADENAKAYVGFMQARPAPPAPKTTPLPTADGGDVLQRGCDALLRARTQAGWWLDYPGFTEGTADEWVTAYVAHAGLETGDPRLRAAAERAWSLLSARPRDGWGWNFVQPADADSTACALRLAQSLGRLDEPRAQLASAFLARHIAADGGVATYLPESHRTRFPDLDINPGWHHAHLCVTATVAGLAPLAGTPRTCLLREQQADGTWQGYWWADPAYATATATAALSGATDPAAHAATVSAARWAQTRLANDTSLHNDPFVLALLLRTALHAPTPDAILLRQAAHDLSAQQHRDGLWPGSARLRIPNGAGQLIAATDRYGIFTTATVLAALTSMDNAGYLP
jgi:hypothetical protein